MRLLPKAAVAIALVTLVTAAVAVVVRDCDQVAALPSAPSEGLETSSPDKTSSPLVTAPSAGAGRPPVHAWRSSGPRLQLQGADVPANDDERSDQAFFAEERIKFLQKARFTADQADKVEEAVQAMNKGLQEALDALAAKSEPTDADIHTYLYASGRAFDRAGQAVSAVSPLAAKLVEDGEFVPQIELAPSVMRQMVTVGNRYQARIKQLLTKPRAPASGLRARG